MSTSTKKEKREYERRVSEGKEVKERGVAIK